MPAARGNARAPAVVIGDEMPDRRRFAIVLPPLLALLGVAAAILWPAGAAPAAAQSVEPAVTCFEITVGWRICVASAPAPIAAASPLPRTTLTYGAPVTTGSVTGDGDYAFLTDPDNLTTMVTTYEGLRDGLREGNPIGLVMHQDDISGASQAAFYDLVEAGDLVEWREAADCWVRYHVDEVHADPAGDPPRTLLTIQVYSYAFTGCTSGPITTRGTRTFTWTPESIRTGTIQTFFTHGAFVVVPEGWTGTRPVPTPVTMIDTPWPPDPIPDPDLGPGWEGGVSHDVETDALYVWYSRGNERVRGYIYRLRAWPRDAHFYSNNPSPRTARHEWRVLNGRPMDVMTQGSGEESSFSFDAGVYVYDPATGVLYSFSIDFHAPPGADPIEAGIDLVRKFLPAAHASSCQPRAPAGGRSNDSADLGLEDCGLPSTTLTYGAPVTTGSVTDAGDYAFLTDPDDLTTLVTTYEGLRDGSTTGLVIHQTDSGGTSQADFYDLVEAGDLFEWRQASDCFVRYTVTDVKDDPAGDAPRKLLAVAWMTYAFTGCSGAISPTATASFAWGPLPALGGTSLTAPVRHGPYQLVPEDWTGAVEAPESHYPTSYSPFTTPIYMADPDPAVASELPYWREPTLPAGWALHTISRGTVNDPPFGYTASYSIPGGWIGVRIEGYYAVGRGWAEEASWSDGGGVYETRMIHGRPARVMYSPPGLNHDPLFPLTVWVYDPVTQTEYAVYGYAGILLGDKVDAVIAIARSLFESPNPP